MGDYRRGRSVCAERRIARQVRVVAARHGFSRGRTYTVVIAIASGAEQPAPSTADRATAFATEQAPTRGCLSQPQRTRSGSAADLPAECSFPMKAELTRARAPRLRHRVKAGAKGSFSPPLRNSSGSALEATNRSKAQQLGAVDRSPSCLEQRMAVDRSRCSRLTSRRSPVRAGHRPSSGLVGRERFAVACCRFSHEAIGRGRSGVRARVRPERERVRFAKA